MELPTKVEEIIDDYDCMLLMHTRRDESGQLYYCHWLDDVDNQFIYSITPITDETLSKMKSGEIDLREVILSPSTRLFTDHIELKFIKGSISDYGNGVPKWGVTLHGPGSIRTKE